MVKQTIVLDFDGGVHSYTAGWQGATVIPDSPTKGAKEAIAKLRETYSVVIVSSRCATDQGIDAVYSWLEKYGIDGDGVLGDNPPHIVVVDDRALRFEGDWNDVIDNIPKASVPWNKKG